MVEKSACTTCLMVTVGAWFHSRDIVRRRLLRRGAHTFLVVSFDLTWFEREEAPEPTFNGTTGLGQSNACVSSPTPT